MINLGFNNEGAFASCRTSAISNTSTPTSSYSTGYNDLPGDEGRIVWPVTRRNSAILPRDRLLSDPAFLKIDEKAMTLRHGSDLNAAYKAPSTAGLAKGKEVVFQPNLAKRTSAGALEAIPRHDAGRSTANSIRPGSDAPPAAIAANESALGCTFSVCHRTANRWRRRCGSGSIGEERGSGEAQPRRRGPV